MFPTPEVRIRQPHGLAEALIRPAHWLLQSSESRYHHFGHLRLFFVRVLHCLTDPLRLLQNLQFCLKLLDLASERFLLRIAWPRRATLFPMPQSLDHRR